MMIQQQLLYQEIAAGYPFVSPVRVGCFVGSSCLPCCLVDLRYGTVGMIYRLTECVPSRCCFCLSHDVPPRLLLSRCLSCDVCHRKSVKSPRHLFALVPRVRGTTCWADIRQSYPDKASAELLQNATCANDKLSYLFSSKAKFLSP